MKEKIQHRLWILAIAIFIVSAISLLLNNMSFNPNFSIIDAISSPTKKSHRSKDSSKVISTWNYAKEDFAFYDEDSYTETMIKPKKVSYKILENNDKKTKEKKVTLLSNKENVSYQNAVNEVADYLENQGYDIQIKEYTETMMRSMVHAGKFTFFLMNAEVSQ